MCIILSGLTPAQQSVSQLVRRQFGGEGYQSGSAGHLVIKQLTLSCGSNQSGWLDGPFYEEDEVSQRVNTEHWICTRRFPLKQPKKIRLIGDGLESAAYSCYKLTLMDMDAVVSLANTVLRAFSSKDGFNIMLSTGQVLSGRLHHGWQGFYFVGKDAGS